MKAKLKISVASRKEIRKKLKKSDDEIIKEIQNKQTKTVDIAKKERIDENGDEIQELTYYEEVEIKSIDDFLAVREAQAATLEEVEIEEEEEVSVETPVEETIPVEEEKPQ